MCATRQRRRRASLGRVTTRPRAAANRSTPRGATRRRQGARKLERRRRPRAGARSRRSGVCLAASSAIGGGPCQTERFGELWLQRTRAGSAVRPDHRDPSHSQLASSDRVANERRRSQRRQAGRSAWRRSDCGHRRAASRFARARLRSAGDSHRGQRGQAPRLEGSGDGSGSAWASHLTISSPYWSHACGRRSWSAISSPPSPGPAIAILGSGGSWSEMVRWPMSCAGWRRRQPRRCCSSAMIRSRRDTWSRRTSPSWPANLKRCRFRSSKPCRAAGRALPPTSAACERSSEDGHNGQLVPVGDPQSMARALLRLSRDPDRCAQMGERSLARWQERFSFAGMVDDYARLLTSVTGPPTRWPAD